MRLIALGASNLTRGFAAVVNAARTAWGEPIDVIAALGHGRSYGLRSQFLVRSLPGILDSGLWAHAAAGPATPTRALVTDVGNDILYGATTATIVSWVAEAVSRLRSLGAETVLTDLPLTSVRRLSNRQFLLFRSILVPSCRLSLAETVERAEAVTEGLTRLAAAERAAYVRLRDEWYGFDPIHIKPRYWTPAWREIVGGGTSLPRRTEAGPRELGGARLYFAAPERRWVFGFEQRHPQPAVRTGAGTSVWLF